jgi:hypothetical protein
MFKIKVYVYPIYIYSTLKMSVRETPLWKTNNVDLS